MYYCMNKYPYCDHSVTICVFFLFYCPVIHISFLIGNETLWPLLLAMTAVPCLVSLIVLPWFPDSPRYLLIEQGNPKAAEAGEIYSI